MKLNVAQCRSAKKTAAPRGLRRSTRNSSSFASCFAPTQQENIVEFYAGAHCLPVSTLPSPSKAERLRAFNSRQVKTRQSNKHEVTKKSSLPFQDFEQKQVVKQRSFKLEALVESQLCRKSSFDLENDGILTTTLTKQRSFKHEGNTLTKQRSLKQENTELAKQRSFKLEDSNEVQIISRQTSLKIEALIEPRVLSRTCSCTTIGRKRVVGVDDLSHEIDFPDCNSPSSPSSNWEPDFSPRKKFASPRTPSTCLDRSPSASLTVSVLECSPRWNLSAPHTPSTPTPHTSYCLNLADEEYGGDSQLEELPFDLLLRIVCCLGHDDLQPASLVCKRLMKAVSIAQRYHFSFTTPHREKKGKSAQLYLSDEEQLTLKGGLAGTFIRPPTPNAPKHLTRPAELRFSRSEACPFAPRLIQLEAPPPAAHTRKSLRMTAGMVTHRVLFDEDELCEAVAQNTL